MTKTILCVKCDTPMIIDEWNGWRWTCFHCGRTGRLASDEEIKELEEQEIVDPNQSFRK